MGEEKMKYDYTKIEDFLEVELAQDRIDSWYLLTAGQYRINGYFDLFPKSQTWFNAETKQRGKYHSLEKLIDNIL